MPRRTPPPSEQLNVANATRKRRAAIRMRARADELESEAVRLESRWQEVLAS